MIGWLASSGVICPEVYRLTLPIPIFLSQFGARTGRLCALLLYLLALCQSACDLPALARALSGKRTVHEQAVGIGASIESAAQDAFMGSEWTREGMYLAKH